MKKTKTTVTNTLVLVTFILAYLAISHFFKVEKSNSSMEESREVKVVETGTKKSQPPVHRRLPKFDLISSTGGLFDTELLDNNIWIANFIFTSCKSSCPVLTKKMKLFQDAFSETAPVKFVSFSVDPENDTPDKLKNYGKKYEADLNRWYFLTGKWEKIKILIKDGFQLGAPEDPMFHSNQFVLVGRKFRIRGYYESDSPEALRRLKRDISFLITKKY